MALQLNSNLELSYIRCVLVRYTGLLHGPLTAEQSEARTLRLPRITISVVSSTGPFCRFARVSGLRRAVAHTHQAKDISGYEMC